MTGLARHFATLRLGGRNIRIRESSTPGKIARETLKLYFEPERGVFPKQGELDLKGLGQVIQFMAETGDLKPPPPLPPAERFVDLQYLRAAGVQ